jgi:hypothetical protein
METGDIIKIKGWFGFTKDAQYLVKEITNKNVLLELYPTDPKGILSHMNSSWYSKDFIESKI